MGTDIIKIFNHRFIVVVIPVFLFLLSVGNYPTVPHMHPKFTASGHVLRIQRHGRKVALELLLERVNVIRQTYDDTTSLFRCQERSTHHCASHLVPLKSRLATCRPDRSPYSSILEAAKGSQFVNSIRHRMWGIDDSTTVPRHPYRRATEVNHGIPSLHPPPGGRSQISSSVALCCSGQKTISVFWKQQPNHGSNHHKWPCWLLGTRRALCAFAVNPGDVMRKLGQAP